MLWLKNEAPSAKSLRIFGGCLIAASLLFALPSEALRSGLFEFALLSWFHVYIAACTTATMGFISLARVSKQRFLILAGLAAALAVPIVAQMQRGAQFFTGELVVLDQIVEARSPFKLFFETFGPVETASHYSWLILLAPLLLIYYAVRLFKEQQNVRLYYAVWVVFGLGLLMTQFRFYYFGMFVLLTGGLLIVDDYRKRYQWNSGTVMAAILCAILILYQPALRQRLFIVYAPGASPEYASARPLYAELTERCAAEPGVVLANNDDGNPVLFHTDCSVIANNFIMRAEDEAKLAELERLMSSSPDAIRRHDPPINYLLVRARDYSRLVNGEETIIDASPIARQLLIDDTPPAGFTLLGSVARDADGEHVYARLFAVEAAN